ncbi:hypothetical protein Xcc1_32960 [Xanthomonas campestris pv. campestris]|nr:hypothetical protein Xcc1_32960 [Xanthomonas campestris pv. campestris]
MAEGCCASIRPNLAIPTGRARVRSYDVERVWLFQAGTQHVDRYGVEYSPRPPSRTGHRSLSKGNLDHVGAHLGANMYSGLPQIETSQRMTVKNCVAITVFWRAGGHAHAATRNPQPATRNPQPATRNPQP